MPTAEQDRSASTHTSELGAGRETPRELMVEQTILARGITDARVLAAMRRVPRHLFVLDEYRELAYADRALPIPGGQTISQPYIVASMTAAAAVGPSDRCLEIGTGSGYQAAVLAELCAEVYSIEYLPEVAEFGRRNLQNAGYLQAHTAAPTQRVRLRVGDGYRGWPEAAPFDAILVTAAPERVPEPLLQQLAVGGRLVIPIGPERSAQVLQRWSRVAAGDHPEALRVEELFGVRFVPFLGEAAD